MQYMFLGGSKNTLAWLVIISSCHPCSSSLRRIKAELLRVRHTTIPIVSSRLLRLMRICVLFLSHSLPRLIRLKDKMVHLRSTVPRMWLLLWIHSDAWRAQRLKQTKENVDSSSFENDESHCYKNQDRSLRSREEVSATTVSLMARTMLVYSSSVWHSDPQDNLHAPREYHPNKRNMQHEMFQQGLFDRTTMTFTKVNR